MFKVGDKVERIGYGTGSVLCGKIYTVSNVQDDGWLDIEEIVSHFPGSFNPKNFKLVEDEETATISPTGSIRENKGKLPMHLVPPDAIEAMAAVLGKGAEKYDERNWEKNNKLSVPYASLMRHLLKFWEGEDLDPESGLPHTYHILMNAAMLVRYEKVGGELDDRPKGEK